MRLKDFLVCFSSSLDDLEVDSGNDGVLDRPHISSLPLGPSDVKACSRDGLDSSEMSSDFNINQTELLSLSTSLQTKVCDTVLMWIVILLS